MTTREQLQAALAKISGVDLDAIGQITGVTRYPWNSTARMDDGWYRARIAADAYERGMIGEPHEVDGARTRLCPCAPCRDARGPR